MYDGRKAWPTDWRPDAEAVDDYVGDWVRMITQINWAWVALALGWPPLVALRQLHR